MSNVETLPRSRFRLVHQAGRSSLCPPMSYGRWMPTGAPATTSAPACCICATTRCCASR